MSIDNWRATLIHPKICQNPIFIIGAPRSGTTVLAEALGRHSNLWASHESEFLLDLFGRGHVEKAFERTIGLSGFSWLRTQGVGKSEFLAFAGLGLNALFTSRSGGKRWIDHTNLYTHMTDTLAEMFPQAQFIHALRDGRRAVHSTLHFRKRLPPELTSPSCPPDRVPPWVAAGRIAPWAADFHEACVVWSKYVDAAISFSRRHSSRCITVVNEDFNHDAETVFAEMFTFLNLPYEDPPVEFLRSTRINTSFPELYNASNSVPQLSDPWSEWSPEQKSLFLNVAGPTLVLAGQSTKEEVAEMSAELVEA